MLLKLISTTTEMATSTLKTSLKKGEFRAVLNFKAFIHLFKLSFLSCSKTNGEVKPFMTADFLGTFFFNLFDCRFVFAPSCFTDTRLVRTPHYYGQFALSLGRGKPLYGNFLWPLRVHIKVVFFSTSAWMKSISFNKISDYFLLLLLLLSTSFAGGIARNLPPCQWNNIS